MRRTIQTDGIEIARCSLGVRSMRRRIKIEPPNITGSARLRKVEEPSGISSTEKRRAVHRCNFVRDLLAGAEVLLFAEEIPECNVAPDVHTIMIVSVFAPTENLSRCRWYTTPRAEFSRLPRAATLYQPLNRLQPSYLVNEDCRRTA